MILLIRALSRALAFVLLTVVALGCLVAAGFAAVPGDSGLPKLGSLVHAQDASDRVGDFLDRLEDGRVRESNAAAIGAGVAGVVGLVLVAGALLPRRQKTLRMERSSEGQIVARRRPLQAAARALAEEPRGVTRARARLRGRWRRAGGRLRLRVGRGPGAEEDKLSTEVRDDVKPLSDAFSLRVRVRTRRDEKAGVR